MTEAQIEALVQRVRESLHGSAPVVMICDKCGNRLEPRCFEFESGKSYAIFDNCSDARVVRLYDSAQEAIEAFGG